MYSQQSFEKVQLFDHSQKSSSYVDGVYSDESTKLSGSYSSASKASEYFSLRYASLQKQNRLKQLAAPLQLPMMNVNQADGKTYYLDMIAIPDAPDGGQSLVCVKKIGPYSYVTTPISNNPLVLQFFSTATTQFV